ncbi:MAG: hypothetical protein GX931_03535, partial [Acholeplasmataceae bacterium]|nr:hypothetical protein [Acholeplasmataceae bacterium]
MRKIIMIIVLSFLLVGCKQKKPKEIYYELTLPNEITSNQIDNTKVKANELVVLT